MANDLFESDGFILRCFSDCLYQILVRLGILKLNSFYASIIEQIASPFVIGRLQWECGLAHQLKRLVVQVILQVASQQDVYEHCSSLIVIAKYGSAQTRLQCAVSMRNSIRNKIFAKNSNCSNSLQSNLIQSTAQLIDATIIKVAFGGDHIQ